MDLGDEILSRSREAASRVRPVPPHAAELEALRVEALDQLAQLPEPPAFRRASDPVREQAKSRLDSAEALYQRALLYQRAAQGQPFAPQASAIAEALEAQVRALAALAQGQIQRGEQMADLAQERATAVSELGSTFHRLHAERPRVYDRQQGLSRFDPHEVEQLEVTLPCPNASCRKPGRYALAPRSPAHRFQCQACHQPFSGYFGRLRSVEATRHSNKVRYVLRLDELGGRERAIDFEDGSGSALMIAPREFVALLYSSAQALVGVVNLSTGRPLWLKSQDACFLATAAYGVGAPELDTFRAFRDRALLSNSLGRAAVRTYYAVGPHLAAVVVARPRLQRTLRAGLEVLRAELQSRGMP